MKHADFPRRVLLAVTGLTPQVVTETLYALAVDAAQPWVPTEIHLVSTAEGAKRARLSLLDPATGQFHALCRDYGLGNIAFPPENVHIIANAAGQPLTDIRTPEDNTQAADCLLGHVRKLCADDTTALHVSIAGGRKKHGVFRRLCAVPVWPGAGSPVACAGFRSLRIPHGFLLPPRQAQVLHTRDGRPVHTSEARVMLAEIPFVRMRGGLPKAALNHAAPFASLVAAAQQGLGQIRLRFDFEARVAHCGTTSVKLPPNLLAWYAWLAQMAQPVGHREADIQSYLNLFARIVGSTHVSLETARHALRDGFDAAFFEQKTSKLNRALRTALSLAAEPYLVRTAGERPQTRYGLTLPMSARDSCHNLR